MTCVTVYFRSGESLHLCYPTEGEALEALQGLDRDISRASDGSLVTVSNGERRLAFLKRDFRSVELRGDDEGGDATSADEPEEQKGDSPPATAAPDDFSLQSLLKTP